MKSGFKAKPSQLVPEALAITLAGVLTFAMRVSSAPIEPITIFPETAGGVTLNASIFVVLMAAAGTVMYLFIKFGFKRIVKYLINIALLALTFFLFNWYGSLYLLPPRHTHIGSHLDARQPRGNRTSGLGDLQVKGHTTFGRHSSAWRSYWNISRRLDPESDCHSIAVSPGRLRSLCGLQRADRQDCAKHGPGRSHRSSILIWRPNRGMGDMVFYSMLASMSMMNFGPLPFVGASIGLVLGAYPRLQNVGRERHVPRSSLRYCSWTGLDVCCL